jgi:hypothetical protein
MGMASVGRKADMIDFDRKEAGVGHFETDELDEIFPYRFRYSPGSTLIHISANKPNGRLPACPTDSGSSIQWGRLIACPNKLKLVPLRDPLDYCADQLRAEQLGRLPLDGLQHALAMRVIGGDGYRRHQRPLPKILVIDLSHRHVKLVPEPVLQALDYLPLVF